MEGDDGGLLDAVGPAPRDALVLTRVDRLAA